MSPRIYLSCICLMLLLSGVGWAQHNVTSATLSGRIEDASGAVVSGASVTAVLTRRGRCAVDACYGEYAPAFAARIAVT